MLMDATAACVCDRRLRMRMLLTTVAYGCETVDVTDACGCETVDVTDACGCETVGIMRLLVDVYFLYPPVRDCLRLRSEKILS